VVALTACATASPRPTSGPTQPLRVFHFVYAIPESYSVNVVSELPGFKKLQYLNTQTQCTGVWLFNAVTGGDVHERYVAESIAEPMAKRFNVRAPKPERTEGFVPVLNQDAKAVRYAFEAEGKRLESGYLELFDPIEKLSVVALSDCDGSNLEKDQALLAQILATRAPQERY